MTIFRNEIITLPNERRYHAYVPANPVAAQLPAIIVFHGHGQEVTTIARRWGVDLDPAAPNPPVPAEVADYILIFPEADPRLAKRWIHRRAGDHGLPDHDVRFVEALLDEITTVGFTTGGGQQVTANPEKMYAAGFSNGSGMTWQLAYSDQVNRFQGFATVGKGLDPEKVSGFPGNPPPKPLIYIHGTADASFRSPVTLKEVDLGTTFPAFSVREMLNRNGIAAGTAATTLLAPGSSNVTEVVAQLWTGAAAFSYVTVINGGHNWPTPSTVGNPPVATHFNGTIAILEFWRTHAGLPG